jgi:hypothetical protein
MGYPHAVVAEESARFWDAASAREGAQSGQAEPPPTVELAFARKISRMPGIEDKSAAGIHIRGWAHAGSIAEFRDVRGSCVAGWMRNRRA